MEILKKLIAEIKPCKVEKVAVGTYAAAVISSQCGLSSSLRAVCGEGGCHASPKNAGMLEGMEVKELAQYALSSNLLEASIGIAAINSALPIDETGFLAINALELILEKGRNGKVAVIGHFPFTRELRSQTKELFVFEKQLRVGDIPSEKIPELLPLADVVAITATTLIDHTFDEVMKHCRRDAYKIMLGPSTPMTPVMFNYGVDALSGVIVEDEQLLLNTLMQGATVKDLKGRRYVCAERTFSGAIADIA